MQSGGILVVVNGMVVCLFFKLNLSGLCLEELGKEEMHVLELESLPHEHLTYFPCQPWRLCFISRIR